MKENTNKALLTNSIILYTNLAVTSICGFLTTRFALQALGVIDYGLFSVIGGIISLISIINTIMVSTSNRYIAVAIGRNDVEEANQLFNICLRIHIVIALVTALMAYPIGLWYIYNFLNYEGDIQNAVFVYLVSITASIFTFVTVPYHGLLTAKERFLVFCIPSVVSHILRLVLAYVLVCFFEHKLFIYASFMAIMTLYPCIIYIIYCRKHFSDIVVWNKINDKSKVKEIISFSGWVGYGAVAYVGRNQGAAILINAFFSTIMNTALGIANSINSIIGMFAKSITQPIEPQITKSYAAGNIKRCEDLLVMSTKLTYLIALVISSPFFVECEWILSLWLGKVPLYAVSFTILIIIDTLIDSLNAGVKSIIFASGNIKLFQIIPSTIKLLAIVAAYFVLKEGAPSYSLLYVYIVSSVIVVVINQWVLHKSLHYKSRSLMIRSYMPSLLVTILFIPITRIGSCSYPIINISISLVYILGLVWFLGISSNERKQISALLKRSIKSKRPKMTSCSK